MANSNAADSPSYRGIGHEESSKGHALPIAQTNQADGGAIRSCGQHRQQNRRRSQAAQRKPSAQERALRAQASGIPPALRSPVPR